MAEIVLRRPIKGTDIRLVRRLGLVLGRYIEGPSVQGRLLGRGYIGRPMPNRLRSNHDLSCCGDAL
jgi:hypothetical protein